MKIYNVDYQNERDRLNFSKSLNDSGFVFLYNHGITIDLINDVYDAWKKFFHSDHKFQYPNNNIKPEGYYHYWLESPQLRTMGTPMESFYFYPWVEFLSCDTYLQDITLSFYYKLQVLIFDLLQWLVETSPLSIASSIEYLISKIRLNFNLRIIHSPPAVKLPGMREDEVHIAEFRNIQHEDIDILTLLPNATEPGLQLLNKDQVWQDVICDDGSLIINAGDSLQLISNGYYKSTTHRVRNPISSRAHYPRYSMAFFVSY